MNKSQGERRYQGKTNRKKVFVVVALAVLVAAILAGVRYLQDNAFPRGVTVEGVDCSYLTPEKATEKVVSALSEKSISLIFNDSTYSVSVKELGGEPVVSEEQLEKLLEECHNSSLSKEFYIPKLYSVNEETLREYLESLDELEKENMWLPKNASIYEEADGTLAIEEEKYGNYIAFEQAVEATIKAIELGENQVDFGEITQSTPEVLAEDLEPKVSYMNAILDTSIEYVFADGNTYLLDKSILRSWIDDNGELSDEKLQAFLQDCLKEEVETHTPSKLFTLPGTSTTVTLPDEYKQQLDIKRESALLKQELLRSGTYSREPMTTTKELEKYVLVDITNQTVKMYENNGLIVSCNCVTGNESKGTPTREGVFYLQNKETDRVLRGYNSDGSLEYALPVSFWMPFDGGIGLHDNASRIAFGGEIYKTNGSHGCVNLPYEPAKAIYENIDLETLIIVYKTAE